LGLRVRPDDLFALGGWPGVQGVPPDDLGIRPACMDLQQGVPGGGRHVVAGVALIRTAPVRFSQSDMARVARVVERRIRSGMLARYERQTSPESDTIMLWHLGQDEPAIRISRDETGWTYFVYCDGKNWKLLASGTTDDCLTVLGEPDIP
jgi:hypothetical protein